jgi:S-DNA-T family DNA segregation ATPase FtsK/SpoIIIE
MPELPRGEIQIPDPPQAPSPPAVSFFSILLPAVFSVVFVVATILLARSQGSGNQPTYMIMSLLSFGFMAISSIVSLQGYFGSRRKYRREMREREQAYRALLETRRSELAEVREKQQLAARQNDPDPGECLARVERRDRRLWERSPRDDDFLSLRLGVGAQQSAVAVKASAPAAIKPDPLASASHTLAEEFGRVPEAPVTLPLGRAGLGGLVGSRPAVVQASRALAIQIATHHSPDEVKIVALYPAEEAAEWDWLRWLPHVWTDDHRRRLLACDRDAAKALLADMYDTLNRRKQGARLGRAEASLPLPVFVFFLAEPRLFEGDPIASMLASPLASIGLFCVFFADRVQALPPGCEAIAELGPGQPRLTSAGGGSASISFQPDSVSRDRADRFARGLAPLRLTKATGPTAIPATVPLLDILGASQVEGLDVLERWQANEPSRSLAAPIGRRAGAELLELDLHERGHGPHGLAAGATGSGKSELLQSLIASLAVNYHPHELAFVLVDYKGGGMANAFLGMPHLVGTITNLEGNLAMRSLSALKAELKHREGLFAQAGVNHVDAYQRLYREGKVGQPLPHLVMIVDEFAELKAEQPDFMRELVSAVRVGRSLGVHLLLATQKPSGVVDEQIWANSRFRLCLRVERPEDSQEVIKRGDAASLSGSGRCYFQVGQDEVFEMFQSAYGGSPYHPDGYVARRPDEILEILLDGSHRPLGNGAQAIVQPHDEASGTQLQAVVEHIRAVSDKAGLQALPGPWLPPLPEQVGLEELRADEGWDGQTWRPAEGWLEPVVGMVDEPARQHQGPLRLTLGRDGHLAVYGSPGTGKTTFVQTLVTSLALTYSPADVNLYLLDFGGRLLTVFSQLPHVGAVVLADDAERIDRLLRYLVRVINQRKERFGELGVNTLAAYRTASGETLPAIVVVIDNYASFANTYPDHEDTLIDISREGGNLGLHLVLTSTATMLIKTRLSSNLALGVVLNMTDRGEYSTVVGRTEGLEPSPVPGRALIRDKPPLEFQTALPAAGANDVERSAALRTLAEQMSSAWDGPRAHAIRALPESVPLCELLPVRDSWPEPAESGLAVPVGLDLHDLEPLLIDLDSGPHFVIAGPPEGGKTTLLRSWLLALAEQLNPRRLALCLVDFGRESLLPLARLPQVRAFVSTNDELAEQLNGINQALLGRRERLAAAREAAGGTLDERVWLTQQGRILVAIDGLAAFGDGALIENKDRLEQLLRGVRGPGLHVIVAGQSQQLAGSYEGYLKAVLELQTGFVVGGADYDDLEVLKIKLPYGQSGKSLPPGQGFFSRRTRYVPFRSATPDAGDPTLAGLVERIAARAAPVAEQQQGDEVKA